jgi:hypothetical protein
MPRALFAAYGQVLRALFAAQEYAFRQAVRGLQPGSIQLGWQDGWHPFAQELPQEQLVQVLLPQEQFVQEPLPQG